MPRPSFLFFLLFSLLFTSFIHPIHASEITQLSKQVQNRYDTTKTLSFDFKQSTYVSVLEKEIHKQAKATFKKPGKFIIEYEGEGGRLYMSEGKKLWIYQKGDRQVQSYEVNKSTVPTEALIFLGGLGNLKKDFSVQKPQAHQSKKIKLNPELNWLELSPKEKQSQIVWILLGVDPKTFYTQEVYLLTNSQNLSHYFLENRKTNFDLPDKDFHFKKKKVKEVKN